MSMGKKIDNKGK